MQKKGEKNQPATSAAVTTRTTKTAARKSLQKSGEKDRLVIRAAKM